MEGDSRDLLAHLVGVQSEGTAAPFDLLQVVREEPQGPTDLHDTCSISRKGVYSALDPLQQRYIVLKENNSYALTGYGTVLCRAIETTLEDSALDRANLRFLLASENRVALLQELKITPARKATLANMESLPSRTTVHRAIEGFVEKGWVTQNDEGRYGLTTVGERALTAYSRLLDDVHAAESRSEFLYCCDQTVADIPLDAVADAELIVDTPQAPDSSRGVFRELASDNPDDFRGLLSAVSTASADVGDSIIRSGTETELVIPQRVLYNLPTEGHYTTHVKRGLEAQNFEFFVVPDVDVFPVGMALFDGETLYMSPADITRVPDGANAGTIVSSDDALVEWAEALYSRYREQAQTPGRHILEQIWKRVSDSVSMAGVRGSGDD